MAGGYRHIAYNRKYTEQKNIMIIQFCWQNNHIKLIQIQDEDLSDTMYRRDSSIHNDGTIKYLELTSNKYITIDTTHIIEFMFCLVQQGDFRPQTG